MSDDFDMGAALLFVGVTYLVASGMLWLPWGVEHPPSMADGVEFLFWTQVMTVGFYGLYVDYAD